MVNTPEPILIIQCLYIHMEHYHHIIVANSRVTTLVGDAASCGVWPAVADTPHTTVLVLLVHLL